MRKRKLQRILSVVLSVVLFISIPCSGLAYSGSSAIEYSDRWALDRNPAYRSVDSDCANFVSQCLYAGGFPQTDEWYYDWAYNYSDSWYGADSLKNYLKYTYGARQLVSKWTNDGVGSSYAYVNDSSNLVGNGREVVFYDWDGDGTMNHASFCVGTGYDQEIGVPTYSYRGDLINQHTNDHYRVLWHLDRFNAQRDSSELYAFEV